MRAQVDDSGKIGAPAGRAAGQDRGRSARTRAFNNALGKTLKAVGGPAETRGKTARIWWAWQSPWLPPTF
ncbi:MAG TPA: hypothetical protein DIU07_10975 [Rhodobacteraceae bacterium]|nr:hypothetical protein [Paracoccaceae bacterium]